ncbi:MAG: hypothetical protein IJC99_07330 [Clostridia bacterium]|nr:hypothetical protein [Clostridia bacterium]
MKAFARVLSVVLILLMLTLTFASCGARVPKGLYFRGSMLDGVYEGYTFMGKKFSFDVYREFERDDELCYSGTYKFEKDKENSNKDEGLTVGTITFTYIDTNGNEVVEEMAYRYEEDVKGKTVLRLGDDFFYLYVEN